jgi:hypothetical protein
MGWDARVSTIDSAWRWGTEVRLFIADVVRGDPFCSPTTERIARCHHSRLKRPSGRSRRTLPSAAQDVAFEFSAIVVGQLTRS